MGKRWESRGKWVSREKLGGDGKGVGIGCKGKVGEDLGNRWEVGEKGKGWEGVGRECKGGGSAYIQNIRINLHLQ